MNNKIEAALDECDNGDVLLIAMRPKQATATTTNAAMPERRQLPTKNNAAPPSRRRSTMTQ